MGKYNSRKKKEVKVQHAQVLKAKFEKTMPPEKKQKSKVQNVKAQANFEKAMLPEKNEKVKVQHVHAETQAKLRKPITPEK